MPHPPESSRRSAPVILVERQDAVATVTLNRPEAMNALSRSLRTALGRAFRELATDGQTRVVVLTGAGRAFCAGWDLTELSAAGADQPADETGGDGTREMQQAITDFPGPIIGAVNGHAITGGFELALACDLLIASSEARFGDTHARVGILPGWGLSQKLPRWIGIGRAKELAFSGNPIDAATAERWGLVNRVVAPEALLPTCRALAAEMATCVPAVLRDYKRLIDDGVRLPLGEGLELESRRAAESAKRATAALLGERRDAVIARGRSRS